MTPAQRLNVRQCACRRAHIYGAEALILEREADLLERLAQPPQPIRVSKRLPGPDDCDAEGRCWAWRSYDPEEDDLGDFWQLIPCEWLGGFSRWTHWLPAHALPLPAAEVSDG